LEYGYSESLRHPTKPLFSFFQYLFLCKETAEKDWKVPQHRHQLKSIFQYHFPLNRLKYEPQNRHILIMLRRNFGAIFGHSHYFLQTKYNEWRNENNDHVFLGLLE